MRSRRWWRRERERAVGKNRIYLEYCKSLASSSSSSVHVVKDFIEKPQFGITRGSRKRRRRRTEKSFSFPTNTCTIPSLSKFPVSSRSPPLHLRLLSSKTTFFFFFIAHSLIHSPFSTYYAAAAAAFTFSPPFRYIICCEHSKKY